MKHIIKISFLIMAVMLLFTSSVAALEVESIPSPPSSIFHHVTVFNKQKLGEYEVVSSKIFEDLTIEKYSSCAEKGMYYVKDVNGICYKINFTTETKEVIPSLPENEKKTYYDTFDLLDKFEGTPYPTDESLFPKREDYAADKYGNEYVKAFICNHDGISLFMFAGIKLSGEKQLSIISNEGKVFYDRPGESSYNYSYFKSFGKEIIRTEHDILNTDGDLLVKDSYTDKKMFCQLFNGVFYFIADDDDNNKHYYAFCDYDGNLLFKYNTSDVALSFNFGWYQDVIHKESNTYLTDTDAYYFSGAEGDYHVGKISFRKIAHDEEPSVNETPSTSVSTVPVAKSSVVSEASVQSDISSTEETSINEQSPLDINSETEATEAAISTDANKVPSKSKKTILIVISTILGVFLVGGGAAVYFLKIRKI